MKPVDYPEQEPFSEVAAAYHQGCMNRRTVEGIEMGYGDDPYQGLNLFPAERPDGRLLAFIHGGGWTNGYKEWMDFMAPAFTAQGVTFASLGYRLAPKHLFPTALEDLGDALVKLLEVAPEHGADPGKLFVGGHSAGGHYAALLATRDAWWRTRGLDQNPIRGCLPVSGVFDFGPDSGLSMRPRFLGPDSAETDRAASPIMDADRFPDFLIAHGDRDFPHLITQAERMERHLAANGTDVTRIVFEDSNHFDASFAAGDPGKSFVPTALQFMEDHV